LLLYDQALDQDQRKQTCQYLAEKYGLALADDGRAGTMNPRPPNQVIENGYLYVAQPPLYKLTSGKVEVYAYSDEEKDSTLKNKKLTDRSFNIQRYKGLGEMNPEQLWETTMNPEHRILKRINIEDAAVASEVFEMLMGEEVPPRKKFIQTHARYATIDT